MQMHGLTILQLHKEFGAMAKAAVGFIVQVVVRAPCVPRGRRAPALVGLIGFVRMHLFWARGRACLVFTWRGWRRMHTPRIAAAYHLALRVAHHEMRADQRLVLRNELHGARDGDALYDLRGAQEGLDHR